MNVQPFLTTNLTFYWNWFSRIKLGNQVDCEMRPCFMTLDHRSTLIDLQRPRNEKVVALITSIRGHAELFLMSLPCHLPLDGKKLWKIPISGCKSRNCLVNIPCEFVDVLLRHCLCLLAPSVVTLQNFVMECSLGSNWTCNTSNREIQ